MQPGQLLVITGCLPIILIDNLKESPFVTVCDAYFEIPIELGIRKAKKNADWLEK